MSQDIQQVNDLMRDLQLEMLRLVIDLGGTTRADLALHMNVTKRTIDSWLLPRSSSGRRNMSRSQSERLGDFTHEVILKNHYSVVEGKKATSPLRLHLVEFPAIYRSIDDSKESKFSFLPIGPEIEHLSENNGDDWLFISPHLSIQQMESFHRGQRAWRNPLAYEELSFCKYSANFYSLTRMRPASCFLEVGLTLYGGGCLMGSMKVAEVDPYITIGLNGERFAFQFEVVETN